MDKLGKEDEDADHFGSAEGKRERGWVDREEGWG